MSKMKKFAGLLVAMIMVFAMAVTASAAETTYTLTINNTTVGHTYAVYQIYTGDLSGSVLSNVKYGQNYGTPGDKVPDEELKAIRDAEAFAKTAATKVKGDVFRSVSSSADNTVISNLPAGYYLVVETTKEEDVPAKEAMTKYILQVVKNTDVNVKSSETTSQKKVDDKNDSNTSEDAEDWKDSADYDIGDMVPFQLKATVAEDFKSYASDYSLTFHDKESGGLTFDKTSVKVYVDGNEITEGFVVNSPAADGDTFDVSFANLKSIDAVKGGSAITVEYKSKLNEHAKIGSEGNPNTSYITYSNNPNSTQKGEKGKTPDDTVIVFTYKVVVNKVDEKGDALTGAGFTLYKKNAQGEYKAVGEEVKGEKMTQFVWKGIDDGDYKIVETTTPAGYNTIPDQEFTVTASHVDGDAPYLDTLSGDAKTGSVITFACDAEDEDALTTEVENKSGATLPSTGGMGTKLFYLIGAICVIGAGILLISRKRVSR